MALRILALALATVTALGTGAGARPHAPGTEVRAGAEAASEPVRLAQIRDVEIYHDQYGREVLVDAVTGEVLIIREPPPRGEFLFGRRVSPEWGPAYEEDMFNEAEIRRRLRHERRLEQLRRVERLPDYRDYRALPEDFFPDSPEPYPDYGYEPDRVEPRYGLGERERVERRPLGESARAEPPGLEEPETILEDPAVSALPDPAEPPRPEALTGVSEDVARFQILLDRVGASPGVIDGRIGDNVNKAIAAYREITGETLRTYDKDYIEEQLQATGGDAFKTYEITATDVAGPYVASIPEDFGEKAQMERMGYTSVVEMLAERFHMDERYLVTLNPGVNFDRPGTIITVANVGEPLDGQVRRIVADKSARQVRAYGDGNRLIAIYPATIGSEATPSPTGTHTVERIAFNPEYTYNPRINFQQGSNTRVLTIPPGPNGPVGTVWIALSKPTYGIHGTPEPSRIGRTYSNGCIRLTNWDAEELAGMVEPGVVVEFVD